MGKDELDVQYMILCLIVSVEIFFLEASPCADCVETGSISGLPDVTSLNH